MCRYILDSFTSILLPDAWLVGPYLLELKTSIDNKLEDPGHLYNPIRIYTTIQQLISSSSLSYHDIWQQLQHRS